MKNFKYALFVIGLSSNLYGSSRAHYMMMAPVFTRSTEDCDVYMKELRSSSSSSDYSVYLKMIEAEKKFFHHDDNDILHDEVCSPRGNQIIQKQSEIVQPVVQKPISMQTNSKSFYERFFCWKLYSSPKVHPEIMQKPMQSSQALVHASKAPNVTDPKFVEKYRQQVKDNFGKTESSRNHLLAQGLGLLDRVPE